MPDPALPLELLEGLSRDKSAIPWDQAWPVIARAELRLGHAWGRDLLWRWRLWAWVSTRLADTDRCRACGGLITTNDPRAKTCSPACRQLSLRCRKGKKRTPWEHMSRLAEAGLAQAEREIRDARRWLQRTIKRQVAIPPPDLLAYDHLPDLPPRCGKCQDGGTGCDHTSGGMCLRVMLEPRPPTTAKRTP